MHDQRDIVIVGGGLAGLMSSLLLTKAGLNVLLIEKKKYPFHRVCGEYISNEVVGFLKRESLFPSELDPADIKNFQLTSVNGASHSIELSLGGFGISRYTFDHYLVKKAEEHGVEIRQGTTVYDIVWDRNLFYLNLSYGRQIEAKLVIGSFGKRSNLDSSLKREFFTRKSPFLAVKYHIRTDYPSDLITLHNFRDGYCGISRVEGGVYNLCYLSHRNNLKNTGTIENMEQEVLYKNPFLKNLFENSDFIFEKPLVINEVSFSSKSLFKDKVIMCGDSAGMITPLSGNGMAMAIHSAKILTEVITKSSDKDGFNQKAIEVNYKREWDRNFSTRLLIGRLVQRLFGEITTSAIAVQILKYGIGKHLVELTHGKPF